MFSTISCLFDGFAGKLKGESSKLVWLLLVTFLAGWAATFFAGWVSFPSYFAMLEHLPGARIIAIGFTAGIAGFIYFSLAYLAGYCIEHWMNSPVRNYTVLGAKIICIASIVFVSVDFYMNIKGKGYRASEAAGDVQTFTYRTPDSRLEQLTADRTKLSELTSCQIGGLGWTDPKTGKCWLNDSGKKMQVELSASIRRVQQADSTARAAFIVDQTRANNDRDKKESDVAATLRNAVYGVYLFVALFCIVQAYIVESMQIAQYKAGMDDIAAYAKSNGNEPLERDPEEVAKWKDFWEDVYGPAANPATAKKEESGQNIGYKKHVNNSANSEVSHTHNLQVNLVDSLPPDNRGKTYNLTKSQVRQCKKIERAYNHLMKAGHLPSQKSVANRAGVSENTARKYINMMQLRTAGK